MSDVLEIDDLETLRAIAEPSRMAVLELLAEPRSVTELAEALGVPRTRLYHHVQVLLATGLIKLADERRVGAMTERLYALTAKTFRPSRRLLASGHLDERVEAVSTLVLDTTKADLRRAARFGAVALGDDSEQPRLEAGRSIAYLTSAQAAEIAAALAELVARFDAGHTVEGDTRPYALAWALYPTSRRLR